MSRVWVPIDPVLPNNEIFLTLPSPRMALTKINNKYNSHSNYWKYKLNYLSTMSLSASGLSNGAACAPNGERTCLAADNARRNLYAWMFSTEMKDNVR